MIILTSKYFQVALLVSAWIEIILSVIALNKLFVALLVSAWIEIKQYISLNAMETVALLVSAWIEIINALK